MGATVRAYGSQIHPVFMLPALAASWFGSILAVRFSLAIGLLHMAAIFFAVYTAHLKDGYVDFYVRSEDDDHPLTQRGCILGIACSFGAFLGSLGGLWLLVDIWAVVLTLPTWFIGFFHAPQLDMNPVTATAGYPTGIALAILGGFYSQAELLTAVPIAFAAVFLILLCGVKIVDDSKDYEYDRAISKRTVAVVLGRRRARTVAYSLLGLALVVVGWLAASGVFPPSTIGAATAFAIVAGFASRTSSPRLATMLLIRGSYVFLALLTIAIWYEPLKALP